MINWLMNSSVPLFECSIGRLFIYSFTETCFRLLKHSICLRLPIHPPVVNYVWVASIFSGMSAIKHRPLKSAFAQGSFPPSRRFFCRLLLMEITHCNSAQYRTTAHFTRL